MFSIIERSFKFSDNGFGFKIPKICLIKKTCPRKGARPGYEGAIPKGNWYNIWSHLTYNVKSLFIQTLKNGVNQPSERASIADWKDALEKYFHAMQRGYNAKEMKPKEPKQSQSS
ncbi:hypothetical protein [Nostoc sp. DSM 114159]|jgi:hypothetical protein